MTVLFQKRGVVADLVKDPHALAEEVYKAGFMLWEEVNTLMNDSTKDVNAKVHELLCHIELKVSTHPELAHVALMVLLRIPGVRNLSMESGKMIKVFP